MVEAFMREYDLSSEEGVLLMCVAEALLRIPDQDTADKLIRDKLGDADWDAHVGQSSSVLVNASTWGLMLTGHLVNLADETQRNAAGAFRRLVGRMGEPAIRLAVRQAMRIMGHQFVMGRTIEEAIERSRKGDNANYRYSFDMLGEGAFTARDAARYLEAYRKAIIAIGSGGPYPDVFSAPSISVKLSALHPPLRIRQARPGPGRTDPAHPRTGPPGQSPGHRLHHRSRGIRTAGTVPGCDRRRLLGSVAGRLGRLWPGVQAYQKRAPFVLDFLIDLARERAGACRCAWSRARTGIRRSRRRSATDWPATRCSRARPTPTSATWPARRKMLAAGDALYPMFATHNAQTIAAIHHVRRPAVRIPAPARHGRPPVRRDHRRRASGRAVPRVCAGGSHEDLLPYLVQRLLENGANTVSSIASRMRRCRRRNSSPIRVATVAAFDSKPHPRIPQPLAIFVRRGRIPWA
jgi:RHH-type proline utilization regulon transcriptional repressor/proline dehydrogenase/delta 1-pyrroline-5-carboxylate dehydrogenase